MMPRSTLPAALAATRACLLLRGMFETAVRVAVIDALIALAAVTMPAYSGGSVERRGFGRDAVGMAGALSVATSPFTVRAAPTLKSPVTDVAPLRSMPPLPEIVTLPFELTFTAPSEATLTPC